MTKHILLLAALGLALGAIGAIGAQAQEYYSVTSHVVTGCAVADGGYATTDITYTDSFYHGQTKRDTYVQVDTEYHAHWGEEWPYQTRIMAPKAPTSVSFYKSGDWTDNSVRPQLNHDGRAYSSPTQAHPVAALAQSPVTVIEGALTPEQIRRLVNGE
jgi:hypothetical protein